MTLDLATIARDLGTEGTALVVMAAMRAWTDVPAAALELAMGVADGPAPSIAGGVCDGASRNQFDDPFGEVQDMVACSGVLAIGGYCGDSATEVIGDTVFRGIREADITLNPGLATCFGAANVAEVVTHEIGHAIGLGHSSDPDATMYAWAHFDGRGAAIRADDAAGVSALYPGAVVPTTSSTTTTRRTTTSSSTSTTSSTSSTSSTSTTSTSSVPPAPESTSTTSTTFVPTTTTTLPPDVDRDADGLADDLDACPESPAADLVGDDGCSVCPCDADVNGVPWESRLAYIRCVREATRDRRADGGLTYDEGRDSVIHGLVSTCGRPELTRCCVARDEGDRCQITTPEECASGGSDIGDGSCKPNPCP